MKQITVEVSGVLRWRGDLAVWELEGEPLSLIPEALLNGESWRRPSGVYGKAKLTITSVVPELDPEEE